MTVPRAATAPARPAFASRSVTSARVLAERMSVMPTTTSPCRPCGRAAPQARAECDLAPVAMVMGRPARRADHHLAQVVEVLHEAIRADHECSRLCSM